jgi:putative PEP-CTERM system histidine kinase
MELGYQTHAVAAAGFLLLTLGLLVGRWRGAEFADSFLIAAAAATCAWAAISAAAFAQSLLSAPAAVLAEAGRDIAWLLYALRLLKVNGVDRERRSPYALVTALAGIAAVVVIGDAALGQWRDPAAYAVSLNALIGFVVLAVVGLALAENLLRNTPELTRWRVKFLCFAIGGIFAYDFVFHTHAIFYQRIDADLAAARGATNLFILPLFAIAARRGGRGAAKFAVSRQLVFHSATMLGAGGYLLFVYAAGVYLRRYGGSWGEVLQATFLFATAVALAASLLSGGFRAYVRTTLEKYFLPYKYDYRAEWLRFIRTLSAVDAADLPTRVVQAVGDIVDCPDGALWLARDTDRFTLAATWNTSRWGLTRHDVALPLDGPLARFLHKQQWIVNLDELAADPARYGDLTLPPWLAGGKDGATHAWAIVPLIRHERLFGFMVFGRPRAARQLTWEDYDLLKIIGQQAASYLAEHEVSQALAESLQFAEFNRRVAIVAHDLKSVVSQLAMIVANAPRHGGDAAFQADVISTVGDSVEKMKRLMQQLRLQRPASAAKTIVPLAALLRKAVAAARDAGAPVALVVGDDTLAVAADEDRLAAVIGHLLQNAADAVGAKGRIDVRLESRDGMAAIEVADNGPGMDAEFVRTKLFRPFVTTKSGGYGIGVYECREFAGSIGGRLDVVTQPGAGTTMRLCLPLVSGRAQPVLQPAGEFA